MKHVSKLGLITGAVAALVLQGCTFMGGEALSTSDEEGRLLLSTDRAGLEAFGDLMTGLVTTGKASPDQDTAHHQLRKEQNQTKAIKLTFGAKKKQEAK